MGLADFVAVDRILYTKTMLHRSSQLDPVIVNHIHYFLSFGGGVVDLHLHIPLGSDECIFEALRNSCQTQLSLPQHVVADAPSPPSKTYPRRFQLALFTV